MQALSSVKQSDTRSGTRKGACLRECNVERKTDDQVTARTTRTLSPHRTPRTMMVPELKQGTENTAEGNKRDGSFG